MARRPSNRRAFVNMGIDTTDLKRLDRHLRRSPELMAQAERQFLLASARTVQAMAQDEAQSLGSVAAKSAADVRTANSNTVVYGGQGYSMGAEFGSYRYKQFQTWRGNGDDAGYFLWPSVRLFRDRDFIDKWTREVWRVVRDDIVYGR